MKSMFCSLSLPSSVSLKSLSKKILRKTACSGDMGHTSLLATSAEALMHLPQTSWPHTPQLAQSHSSLPPSSSFLPSPWAHLSMCSIPNRGGHFYSRPGTLYSAGPRAGPGLTDLCMGRPCLAAGTRGPPQIPISFIPLPHVPGCPGGQGQV